MSGGQISSQYIDITWLTTFGLNTDNVLDYFYTSPFYETNCNNELIRSQGVSILHLSSLVGLEYNVDLQSTKEPHLYVIRKQYRRSKTATETRDIFYCLDGIIYKCPRLLDILQSRIAKATFHLSNSFAELQHITSETDTDTDRRDNNAAVPPSVSSLHSASIADAKRCLPEFTSVVNCVTSENFCK